MKVTLTFDLPEEKNELLLALHAATLHSALCDLDREFRAHLKHGAELRVACLRRELHDTLAITGWQD